MATPALSAARAKATVGEISLALEKVFGRHKARADAVQGVYLKAAGNTPASDRARALTAEFKTVDGRQPRILAPGHRRRGRMPGMTGVRILRRRSGSPRHQGKDSGGRNEQTTHGNPRKH